MNSSISITPDEIGSLVQSDRVHRSVYTDGDLFDIEMDKIFHRSWLYIGHDSQIPNAGDYFTTRMGKHPVIVVRQKDDSVRVMLNRCQHKGMQLVADDTSGNAPTFVCGYHAWTYENDGELKSIPAAEGYEGTGVCKGAKDLALSQVAAVEVYRGFIFAHLHGDGPDFMSWLGPMKSSLDNFVDRSPSSKVKVEGGVFRYEHDANWKFFTENTLDALHPMMVHGSATRPAQVLKKQRAAAGKADAIAYDLILPFRLPTAFFNEIGQRGTDYGHGDLGNSGSMHATYDEVDDYSKAMTEAYGEEKANEILGISRNNSLLYPSLMFKAPVSLLRVIKPIAVDKTIIETWHFRLVDAPEELFERTILYSSIVNSSAGMVGPDDHAAYQRLQSGLQTQESEWVHLSRYLDQETTDDEGAQATIGTSDYVFRNQFAAWQQYMVQA